MGANILIRVLGLRLSVVVMSAGLLPNRGCIRQYYISDMLDALVNLLLRCPSVNGCSFTVALMPASSAGIAIASAKYIERPLYSICAASGLSGRLQGNILPIFEPGLGAIVKTNVGLHR